MFVRLAKYGRLTSYKWSNRSTKGPGIDNIVNVMYQQGFYDVVTNAGLDIVVDEYIGIEVGEAYQNGKLLTSRLSSVQGISSGDVHDVKIESYGALPHPEFSPYSTLLPSRI